MSLLLIYVDRYTRTLVVGLCESDNTSTDLNRITTCSGSITADNEMFLDYTNASKALDYIRNLYPGQGSYGWRNFVRFLLPSASLNAAQPLAVKARLIADRWWSLCFKSEPRWRVGRWKAKT